MIEVTRKWMRYTYFSRKPLPGGATHLHSLSDQCPAGYMAVPFPTMLVDIRKDDFLQSWSSSTRTKVNKAVRENLVADRGRYLLPDIIKLFASVAKAKSLRGYPASHFNAFYNLECSVIMYEGTMICGHIWLLDMAEKRALLYVNATNRFNLEEDTSMTGQANYFLLWQDGLHLRNLGIDTLDLMGYDPESTDAAIKGISQWKAGTHGQKETVYHYYPVWFFLLRKLRNMLPV